MHISSSYKLLFKPLVLTHRLFFFFVFLSGIILGALLIYTIHPFLNSDTIPTEQSQNVTPIVSSSKTLLNEDILTSITDRNADFKYVRRPDVLVVGMTKSGSTSFWNWMYRSMKGHNYTCTAFVQSLNASPCWGDDAYYLNWFNASEQLRLLKSPSTLRVALWRDPFGRAVSAWKSKVTCEGERFGTDVRNRERVVANLRVNAALPGMTCMNITEYASTLDIIRTRILNGEIRMKNVDPHVRTQEHYSHLIQYDAVFTVAEAAEDVRLLDSIVARVQYKDVARVGLPNMHTSTGGEIEIPEEAARKIAAFAALTKPRPAARTAVAT